MNFVIETRNEEQTNIYDDADLVVMAKGGGDTAVTWTCNKNEYGQSGDETM